MIVRVRGINRVRARGRDYFYHRATGTRLRSKPGTPAFAAEVAAIEAKLLTPPSKDGSLDGLVMAYRLSPEFRALASRTRSDYDKVFEYLRPIGETAVIDFTPALVIGIRDRVNASKKRAFANMAVKVLRLLFAWGRLRGMAAENPAKGVPLIKRPHEAPRANRPWAREEQANVLASAPIHLRWPIALAAFAGLSQADVVAFPRSAIVDGRIRLERTKTNVPLDIPLHRELMAIKVEYESWLKGFAVTELSLSVNSFGRRWTGDGLRSSFFKLLKALEQEGKVGPHLTFHGLRHTVGGRLAEAGCDPAVIQAILGHKTQRMAEYYSRGARRGRLADRGIRALENDWET